METLHMKKMVYNAFNFELSSFRENGFLILLPDTQTHTQNNYCNPHRACTPRVNKVLISTDYDRQGRLISPGVMQNHAEGTSLTSVSLFCVQDFVRPQ